MDDNNYCPGTCPNKKRNKYSPSKQACKGHGFLERDWPHTRVLRLPDCVMAEKGKTYSTGNIAGGKE